MTNGLFLHTIGHMCLWCRCSPVFASSLVNDSSCQRSSCWESSQQSHKVNTQCSRACQYTMSPDAISVMYVMKNGAVSKLQRWQGMQRCGILKNSTGNSNASFKIYIQRTHVLSPPTLHKNRMESRCILVTGSHNVRPYIDLDWDQHACPVPIRTQYIRSHFKVEPSWNRLADLTCGRLITKAAELNKFNKLMN